MLLDLLDDLPTARTFAVDEDGVLWLRFESHVAPPRPMWGRGCLSDDRARHVFLRPCWAIDFAPLTLDDYLERFAPEQAA